MEHLATADPLNSFTLDDGQYHSEPSYVCRFALGVAVYAGISLIQVDSGDNHIQYYTKILITGTRYKY